MTGVGLNDMTRDSDPDLFMKWCDMPVVVIFSSDVPDSMICTVKAFANRYLSMKARRQLCLYKNLQAEDLWRRILSMLLKRDIPGLRYGPCNVRSPQQHCDKYSSQPCTEIRRLQSATCPVNLARHVGSGLDQVKLNVRLRRLCPMLDIDIVYYAVEGRNSNYGHRLIGLGLMGFQDSLYRMRIPYASGRFSLPTIDRINFILCNC